MSNFVISIDGGGTKTLGVLYNLNGLETKRVVAPSSNFAVDAIQAKKVIQDVIYQLIKVEHAPVMHIGVAGYSMIKDIKALEEELSNQFHSKVNIHPDAHLGLYSVYQENLPLIYVVGGTGSIIYTLNNDKINRYGGYGHLFGDEGSAYSVVMSLFKDILETMDLNKSLNKFQQHILKTIGATDRTSLIGYIYRSKKQEIASLAQVLSMHSSSSYAKKILKNEAKKITSNILTVYKKSGINSKFMLALRGGFIEKAYGVKEQIIEILKKKNLDFIVEVDVKEAVYGGYMMALISDRKES
ncbi:BadF/BadG/BcrA/BcrD ATPase family protein [Acholeplasma hippikon]|uniref:BadF/BadG/BcrA/BcrD ATPase family n=1 Tax=Acholeplasma hippikon TaxID=264636 RepID=A0A449BK31_9MOLU|nr:BadF/BadG/BcrA/BcrD ATPase family protein [Acholeplasma hippikon]VEU82802.1 BadF/BadG/BcrA/BcrD ATPase family [Acholeplasma hippikon]